MIFRIVNDSSIDWLSKPIDSYFKVIQWAVD